MGASTKVMQIEGVESAEIFAQFEGLRHEIKQLKTQIQAKEPNTLWSRTHTAKALSVSLVTLDDWTDKGILQAYRLGSRIYYKSKEVNEALQSIQKGKKGGEQC
jgi:hypothetical protein